VDANSSLKKVVKDFKKATDIILKKEKKLFEMLSKGE